MTPTDPHHAARSDRPAAPATPSRPALATASAGALDVARWARSGTATIALVATVLALRLAYLAWLCPYDLIEDEAHYWEWSRNLEWSYYSKGPGIAWTIALATGALGTSEWAIRAPAALAGAALALLVAALASDIASDRRAGFFAAAAVALAPALQLTALFTTIDGPYLACWAAACWAAWRALVRRSRAAWIALGAAIGAGLLFKYTILLLVPGLVAFAAVNRHALRLAPRSGAWLGAGTAAALAGALPVILWNAATGWPTVRHLLGHLGLRAGDMPAGALAREPWQPAWTFGFLGAQLAMIGPLLVPAAWMAWRLARARLGHADRRAGTAFALWCAAPIAAFYLLVSFRTEPEANWALGAYVTLLALAGVGVLDGLADYRARLAAWLALPPGERPWRGSWRRKPETPPQAAWHIGIGYGLVAGLAMLRADLVGRLPFLEDVVPVRRMVGAHALAADVQALVDRQRAATGAEPLVIAQHYGRASQLAFYLPGQPTVYCASAALGGRRTQYDLWSHTDLSSPALQGRPGVLLGATGEQWQSLFQRVEPLGMLPHETKRARLAFLAEGFRPPAEHQP